MSAPNGYLPFPKDFATHAIHQDQDPDKWSSKSVVTPVHTSTTYKQSEPGNYKVINHIFQYTLKSLQIFFSAIYIW